MRETNDLKQSLLNPPPGGTASFVKERIKAGDREWTVFIPANSPQNGPPVLLLHEMPTLGAETLQLAQRLAGHGYTVYVPVLFGDASDDPESISAQLRFLRFAFLPYPRWRPNAIADRPIASELAELTREILRRPRHGGQRIGVIGMCISGSLPLELLGQSQEIPELVAPVLSQPSIPILPLTEVGRSSLGLSARTMQRAVARIEASGIQVLGFRFEGDKISPKERFETLDEALNGRGGSRQKLFLDETLPASRYRDRERLPENAHAVLTDGYRRWESRDPEEPVGHESYRKLVAFLDLKLKGPNPRPYVAPRSFPPGHRPVNGPEEVFGGDNCPRPALGDRL